MTDKLKVPKEVAKALDYYVLQNPSNTDAFLSIKRDGYTFAESITINNHFSGDDLMSALVIGYEAEASPEDKVLEYYKHKDVVIQFVIEETLELLGIKIEGINA